MLIDSLPIVLAKNSRSSKANVARELADKGYYSSKKMCYYGVKLHVIGTVRTGTLPLVVGLTQASCHDLKAFLPIVKNFRDAEFFGDKAYCDSDLQTELKALNNVMLITPIKKKRHKLS